MAQQIGTENLEVLVRFYDTVLAVWENQHTVGHWQSLRTLLHSVADILSIARMAVFLQNPTDPSTAVLYASSDPDEQCPRYGSTRDLGFPPDAAQPQTITGLNLLTFPLKDADGGTLGHIIPSLHIETASPVQVQLVRHTALIFASLFAAAINRRLERLRTQVLLGGIDPFIGFLSQKCN